MIKLKDKPAVWAAIKRHLPHIAARVEGRARLLEEMGFPVNETTLLRAAAFEEEFKQSVDSMGKREDKAEA